MKKTPESEANQILQDLNFNQLPVDPVALCDALNIIYKEDSFDSGDGFILSNRLRTMIIVNNKIRSQERKRFTTAHELGHYVFDIDSNPMVLCKELTIDFESKADVVIEKRANEFASHLLMPTGLIPNQIKHADPSWDIVGELSKLCQTSLPAAALRYVTFSRFPCHLVCLRESYVQWSVSSHESNKKVQPQVRKKDIARNGWFRTPFSDWFYDSPWDRGRYVLEWGTNKNQYGYEHVLLWEEKPDEDDNDEYDDDD